MPFQRCHWSIYSQDHYYHLTESTIAGQYSMILRDDDYSAPQDLSKCPPAHTFVAYHIGTTDYHSAQIHRLAKWAMTKMAENRFSAVDSQRFVSELGARIICGPRNSTVLMGGLLQIAEQEFHLKNDWPGAPIPSGFPFGLQLAGPKVPIDTARARLRHRVQVESSARSLALCWKDGRHGAIAWNIHEYHPLLRPLGVADQQTLLGSLKKMDLIFQPSKGWVPSNTYEDRPLASVYSHKQGMYTRLECLDKRSPITSSWCLSLEPCNIFARRKKWPANVTSSITSNGEEMTILIIRFK